VSDLASLPLVESRTIGKLKVHAIQAGIQKLDGGAMFGVVPRTLWERKIKPDERHRILLGMRCLLIEHESGLVLIDSGAGNKENEKFHEIYGVENKGEGGATRLEDGLAQLSVRREDVGLVINTHLHFDHAGGSTMKGPDGASTPTFPKARYVIQAGEYEYATHTNERTAASYFPHNIGPIQARGQFDLVIGEQEIVKGISVIPTPGHVPYHQGVKIESEGEVAFYVADLVPTTFHLPLPWIMGYDVEPLRTLETKRKILTQAATEGWQLVLEHDAQTPWTRIAHDGKAFAVLTAKS
jgi:glyoxylase-like metal-dependent hydrolase (beta-lactamase superfamily II)